MEICNDPDEIKWIKAVTLKLIDTIPFDDYITHNYLCMLLCRAFSISIPSSSDLSFIQAHMWKCISSNQVFLRNTVLTGILSLLECLHKTSTSIGKLSDELLSMKSQILDNITSKGIITEG